MGIQGLLPFLKKIHEPVNVSQFAGCTVAIDAYCWLHKGAFSCAEKLALGEKTDQYVYYCMKFINTLLAKNIKPVMVFDGCHLPSKKNVEKSRREKRELNKKKAAQFLREGKRAEARECLQRCIDITPEMALELMNVCRNKGVDCIVAPYEADSQLAYLNKIGVAQVIITEDSDLLLFGCEKVLFKMDHAGNGILIKQARLNEVTDIQTAHYSFEKFRYMCILSGCDYLSSLPGIGLAKANKVFKIARQGEITQLLKKLSTYLKSSITVPQEYIDGFIAADNTFLYQLVFDPLKRKLVPLNPYPADINPDELSYAGSQIPAKKALHIALGNINIYNGEMFADFNPSTFVPKYVKKKPDMLHMLSIWDPDYRIKPKCVLKETQLQERPNLKGKEVQVKRNKKDSPQKRIREVEDSKDVKSDNELHEMYASPVKKRARVEDVDKDLHRFMFASKQDVRDEEVEGEAEEKLPATQPRGSPKFFNSLSHAHPEVIDESAGNDVEADKENGIVSPGRNIFACKSPSKRQRFNLNATKQTVTKSRFFGSASKGNNEKILKKNSPKQIQIEQVFVEEYKPVHSNTANVYIKNEELSSHSNSAHGKVNKLSDIKIVESGGVNSRLQCEVKSELINSVTITELPSSQCFKFSKSESVTSNSPMSSPASHSAFNWSKFKFNRQSSCESISEKSQSSKTSKNPFKKVVSESNIDSLFKKSERGDNSVLKSYKSGSFEGYGMATVVSPVGNDISEQTSLSQCDSVHSLPYSIDSDCVRDSDFIASQSSSQTSQCFSQVSNISSTSERNTIGEDTNVQQASQGVEYLSSNNNFQNLDVKCKNNIIFRKGNVRDVGDEAESECGVNTLENDKAVVVIDSDEESGSSSYFKQKVSFVSKSPVLGKSSVSEKGKIKTGCRVSGLSKKSKRTTKNIPDDKQKSLKEMFSKFAHKPW